MKKLDTLKKTLESITETVLADIIQNENVDVKTLTESEKLAVLMYQEIAKSINSKKHTILLDCNYSQSKFVQNEIYLVDYYRLAVANSMIQVYVRKNSFRICTSASKSNREKFATLESELQFKTKYDSKTHRAKTTERLNISYDDIVAVIKQVIAILESTAQNKDIETE
jgi:cellulose biosynthesis protein BcsQ